MLRVSKTLSIFLAFSVFLNGCGDVDGEEKSLSGVESSADLLTQEQDDGTLIVTPDGSFLDANPSYLTLAARILTTNPSGGLSSVNAARFRSQALRQTLYPQVRPTFSVDQNGDPVGRIGVSQIVFSNGQFQAEKGALRASEIEAVANYLVASNQRVSDGVLAYLEIDYYRRLANTAQALEKRYVVLVDQAERRVAGGVGDETEIATFKLKLLEARADYEVNRANQKLAAQRVQDLTAGLQLPAIPAQFQSVNPKSEPPEIVLLMAQRAAAESQISLERARRRPTISIDAFKERNFETSTNDDGISLGVGVAVPLGVRNDLEISAAVAERDALDADLLTAKQDVSRRTAQLQASIARDKARLSTLQDLIASAEDRLDSFEEQFLSGTVSIEEAVSILETYRRSMDQQTEARNEILKAQVEIARTNGQLLPGSF